MPLFQITASEQKIRSLAGDLCAASREVDLNIQHVFANYLFLASAGHVEKSVRAVLSEYARRHGNDLLKRYVERSVSRQSSLNCRKIKSLTDMFNSLWWDQVLSSTSEEERDAVDSIKALRDKIAHGEHNGTGFATVDNYHTLVKRFVQTFSGVILDP